MSLVEKVTRRVEPAAIRYYQWRGDPLARWIRPQTRTDPYPLYADIRRRSLVRSALGPWMTADHAAAESVLRDRRFSSSPVHQRGYRPPAYPGGDPRGELPAATCHDGPSRPHPHPAPRVRCLHPEGGSRP